MGLKFQLQEIQRLTSSWLKSDHFGIEILLTLVYVPLPLALKSDHFGIEINVTGSCQTTITTLKSDHFGIEMVKNDGTIDTTTYVKIRPFWD